jgi:hypothetical protein
MVIKCSHTFSKTATLRQKKNSQRRISPSTPTLASTLLKLVESLRFKTMRSSWQKFFFYARNIYGNADIQNFQRAKTRGRDYDADCDVNDYPCVIFNRVARRAYYSQRLNSTARDLKKNKAPSEVRLFPKTLMFVFR